MESRISGIFYKGLGLLESKRGERCKLSIKEGGGHLLISLVLVVIVTAYTEMMTPGLGNLIGQTMFVDIVTVVTVIHADRWLRNMDGFVHIIIS